MRLEAMSPVMPTMAVPHVNAMPFRGTLVRLDQPSDNAPNGSGGKRIILTRGAAAGLGTLLGMPVNASASRSDHSQQKVGVVTGVQIENDAIVVDGHFFRADFEALSATIKAQQSTPGMSFKAQSLVTEPGSDPLKILSCVVTGASVIRKASAAYRTTSIAAASERTTVPVHPVLLKALTRAGSQRCDGGDRLSSAQLDRLMVGDVTDRTSVKQLVVLADLWPLPFPG